MVNLWSVYCKYYKNTSYFKNLNSVLILFLRCLIIVENSGNMSSIFNILKLKSLISFMNVLVYFNFSKTVSVNPPNYSLTSTNI